MIHNAVLKKRKIIFLHYLLTDFSAFYCFLTVSHVAICKKVD